MAKLVLALALGAQALLAPSNKLPVNTVRRAASTAPEMVVKVGVIGAGRIGLVHLEALSQTQDAECVIISNPTVSKAEAAAKQYFVPEWSAAVWKSTSVSGAPDNSSLSHFSAMPRSSWLGRAVRNRHRHAIEQASRRWRGDRRTRRKFGFRTDQYTQ